VTNPVDEFFGTIGDAVNRAMNPEPTDVYADVKDGKFYLKIVYGNTSGGELSLYVPDKDLLAIQGKIIEHLTK
jgi:hypothetical protein